jgi:hypothetical protein
MLYIRKLAKRAEYARGILEYLSAQHGQALAEHSLLLAFIAAGSVTLLGALGLLIAAHINSLTIGLP